MTIDTRIAILTRQLNDADALVNKAHASVKRAQRKFENAQSDRDDIMYELDMEIVKSWRGNPDWKMLLDNPDEHSSIMYDALNELLVNLELSCCGIHAGTGQRVLSFSFLTNSPNEVEKRLHSITLLKEYIKPYKGKKSFDIRNLRIENCAYLLSIPDQKENEFNVEKLIYGSVDTRNSFSTLREALVFVQSNICDVDLVADNDFLEHIA